MSEYVVYGERVNPVYDPEGRSPDQVRKQIITAFISTGEAENLGMRRDDIAAFHNVDPYDDDLMRHILTQMRRHDARRHGNPEN